MLYYLHAWSWLHSWSYWWIDTMILVWLIFTLMLFLFEPLVLRRRFRVHVARDTEKTFAHIRAIHQVLLLLSLIAIAGAVAGSNGWVF